MTRDEAEDAVLAAEADAEDRQNRWMAKQAGKEFVPYPWSDENDD